MSMYASAFADTIDEYMRFRTATGFSSHHAKILRRFDAYCATFHPTISTLTRDIVRGWYFYEVACGYSGLDQKASTIRCFARFVGGDSYILPMDCVPKHSRYVPYILTDEELRRLFHSVDDFYHEDDPFLSHTLKVLYRLIYGCGLRPNEGRNLTLDAINFSTGELLITKTKRRKERIVVASDEVLQLLKKYRWLREIIAVESEIFFVHTNGKPLKSYEMTRYFKECWSMANPDIPKEQLPYLRVYDLRHRFASAVIQKWLDEGKNLYAMLPYLRSYMGHARFEDTAYYIHLLPDRLAKSPGVEWENIDKTSLEEELWSD